MATESDIGTLSMRHEELVDSKERVEFAETLADTSVYERSLVIRSR
jgi:hypothetical protein